MSLRSRTAIFLVRPTRTRTGAHCLLELLETGAGHVVLALRISQGYGLPSVPTTLTGRWPSGNSALHLLEEGERHDPLL